MSKKYEYLKENSYFRYDLTVTIFKDDLPNLSPEMKFYIERVKVGHKVSTSGVIKKLGHNKMQYIINKPYHFFDILDTDYECHFWEWKPLQHGDEFENLDGVVKEINKLDSVYKIKLNVVCTKTKKRKKFINLNQEDNNE